MSKNVEKIGEPEENLGIVRKIEETVDFRSDKLEDIHSLLSDLNEKMDKIDRKLDRVITKGTESDDLKDVHERILDLLGNWLSTKNLAKILNYRQEYVSRKVSELKKMGLVEEKRDGKSIKYRRKDGVREALD